MLLRGTSSGGLSLEAFMLQRMPNPGQPGGQGEERAPGEVAASALVPPSEWAVQEESQDPEGPAPKDEPPADLASRGGRGRGNGRGGRRGRGRGRNAGKTTFDCYCRKRLKRGSSVFQGLHFFTSFEIMLTGT